MPNAEKEICNDPFPPTPPIQKTRYRTAKAGPATIFYREAGDPERPTVLLLHGFPTSSHMFRDLMPRLADRYHVVAPDLPGFGFSAAPDRDVVRLQLRRSRELIGAFTEALGLDRFAILVFDYGAPVGFRLALATPNASRRSSPRTATPMRKG